jgi:hypothetical protein
MLWWIEIARTVFLVSRREKERKNRVWKTDRGLTEGGYLLLLQLEN